MSENLYDNTNNNYVPIDENEEEIHQDVIKQTVKSNDNTSIYYTAGQLRKMNNSNRNNQKNINKQSNQKYNWFNDSTKDLINNRQNNNRQNNKPPAQTNQKYNWFNNSIKQSPPKLSLLKNPRFMYHVNLVEKNKLLYINHVVHEYIKQLELQTFIEYEQKMHAIDDYNKSLIDNYLNNSLRKMNLPLNSHVRKLIVVPYKELPFRKKHPYFRPNHLDYMFNKRLNDYFKYNGIPLPNISERVKNYRKICEEVRQRNTGLARPIDYTQIFNASARKLQNIY